MLESAQDQKQFAPPSGKIRKREMRLATHGQHGRPKITFLMVDCHELTIAGACAFFADDLCVRAFLWKHLPSVLAQFEPCLGLNHQGLDVFSEPVTYIWRPFGSDLARYSCLICDALGGLCEPRERMRHPFGDDLVRHFGVSGDGRRFFCEPTGPQK